ncbi:hypothetical protein HQ590_12470 [bacterium]|nr:hypothetical protein [bacterium]
MSRHRTTAVSAPAPRPLSRKRSTYLVETQNSLARFKRDHGPNNRVAFVVMKFGGTPAHNKILEAIRATLVPHGIAAVRADDKQYHDDLYYNIMTYIYGCAFGIAVFERIEAEEFNPNVAFEVGYLTALGKPLCLLKDKTLKALHTDLIGKLYTAFDPQNVLGTIVPALTQWLDSKGLVTPRHAEVESLSAFLSDAYWTQFCRLTGQTLDDLFRDIMHENSFERLIARCVPDKTRRRALLTALTTSDELLTVMSKANRIRRLAGLVPYKLKT